MEIGGEGWQGKGQWLSLGLSSDGGVRDGRVRDGGYR